MKYTGTFLLACAGGAAIAFAHPLGPIPSDRWVDGFDPSLANVNPPAISDSVPTASHQSSSYRRELNDIDIRAFDEELAARYQPGEGNHLNRREPKLKKLMKAMKKTEKKKKKKAEEKKEESEEKAEDGTEEKRRRGLDIDWLDWS